MPDLRPMGFGEILDGSLMIYRRHFGLFLKLAMAALSVPLVLLVYFGLRAIAELQQNPVRALVYLLPVGLVYYVASLVLTAGTIRVISDSYLGREPRLRDALALGWSRLWPLTAVGFGKGIVLMLIVVAVGVVAGVGATLFRGAGAPVAWAPVLGPGTPLSSAAGRVRGGASPGGVGGGGVGFLGGARPGGGGGRRRPPIRCGARWARCSRARSTPGCRASAWATGSTSKRCGCSTGSGDSTRLTRRLSRWCSASWSSWWRVC